MPDNVVRSAKVLSDLLQIRGIREAVDADPTASEQISDVLTKSWPPPAYIGDTLVYRLCVAGLVLAVVICLVGAIYLSTVSGAVVPDMLTAIAAGALGGLVGLFAPSPAKSA